MFLHARLSGSWPVNPKSCQIATWPKRQYVLRLEMFSGEDDVFKHAEEYIVVK
jgi:hypothetical protein